MGVRRETEESFQRTVTDLATLYGWDWYHTHDSQHSPDGFPDLVLTRGGVLIFAELKVGRNKPTAAQQHWLTVLQAVAASAPGVVLVRLWYPRDWSEIEGLLGSE